MFLKFIIFLAVFAFGFAIVYNWLFEKMYKDRSDEQKKAIRYFIINDVFKQVWFINPFVLLARACKLIPEVVSDNEYDEMLSEEIKSLKLREKALQKIGLDESEIKEIAPITFEGYKFDEYASNALDNNSFQKRGGDMKWRSSKYEVTWIFASNKELYAYSFLFNMTDDTKKERTEEFFWKDITNFSTVTETKSVGYDWNRKTKTYKSKKTIDEREFAIAVPGSKYVGAAGTDESVERIIQGMKTKLREIKEKNS